jgi:hypothetical protein
VWLGLASLDVFVLEVGSPKSQAREEMEPSASVLASAKAHAAPTLQLGAVKAATGGVFGPTLLPPPQAHAAPRITVDTANRGIDRIESSQPKVTE